MADVATEFRFTLPYDWDGLSKNRRYGRARAQGRTYLNPAARAMHVQIVEAVTGSGPWVTGPLHLDIHVVRPDKRGDPINCLQAISDAVQEGIGVDDRWYSANISWSLDRENPRVEVALSQVVTEEHNICSRCAELLPATAFWKNQSRCKPCQKAAVAEGPNPTKRGKNKRETEESE